MEVPVADQEQSCGAESTSLQEDEIYVLVVEKTPVIKLDARRAVLVGWGVLELPWPHHYLYHCSCMSSCSDQGQVGGSASNADVPYKGL